MSSAQQAASRKCRCVKSRRMHALGTLPASLIEQWLTLLRCPATLSRMPVMKKYLREKRVIMALLSPTYSHRLMAGTPRSIMADIRGRYIFGNTSEDDFEKPYQLPISKAQAVIDFFSFLGIEKQQVNIGSATHMRRNVTGRDRGTEMVEL
ncbi:hypothetical protein B0H34DRAFT_679202 [Crassisporium funariophilum]|nr:hypothetical protein B0H34DRAFT_679202 [Crassisporium funariophilum]